MKLFTTIFFIVMMSSCGRSPFREFPAEKYLSDADQISLVRAFIKIENLSIANTSQSKEVLNLYDIQYFLTSDSANYFLITYDGNPYFKNESFHCFGGTVSFEAGDTVFSIMFERQTFRTSEDSVKLLFNKMIAGDYVAHY